MHGLTLLIKFSWGMEDSDFDPVTEQGLAEPQPGGLDAGVRVHAVQAGERSGVEEV